MNRRVWFKWIEQVAAQVLRDDGFADRTYRQVENGDILVTGPTHIGVLANYNEQEINFKKCRKSIKLQGYKPINFDTRRAAYEFLVQRGARNLMDAGL